MTPWPVNLVADRWTPFDDSFQFPVGVDLTGATLRAQIRRFPDETGASLVDLANASAAGQGLSFALVTDPDTDLATSTVRMRINETTLETLLSPGFSRVPIGGDLSLAWDLHITLPGVGKRRWIAGDFLLRAGATQ